MATWWGQHGEGQRGEGCPGQRDRPLLKPAPVRLDYSSEEKVTLIKLLTVFKGLRTGLNYNSEENVTFVKLLTIF